MRIAGLLLGCALILFAAVLVVNATMDSAAGINGRILTPREADALSGAVCTSKKLAGQLCNHDDWCNDIEDDTECNASTASCSYCTDTIRISSVCIPSSCPSDSCHKVDTDLKGCGKVMVEGNCQWNGVSEFCDCAEARESEDDCAQFKAVTGC